MGIPEESYRNAIGVSLKFDWNPLQIPWESHRHPMGIPLDSSAKSSTDRLKDPTVDKSIASRNEDNQMP